MTPPIAVDFRARLVLPHVEPMPDGALRLSLTTHGPEQLVLYLSYPSLEALSFELTTALLNLRRC
jgi:hypothetical protein